jgi:hypothetical protein
MKLSDVMSAMGLATYAEAALVIFLVVFAAVAVDVLRGGKRKESLAALPLSDDTGRRTECTIEGVER